MDTTASNSPRMLPTLSRAVVLVLLWVLYCTRNVERESSTSPELLGLKLLVVPVMLSLEELNRL